MATEDNNREADSLIRDFEHIRIFAEHIKVGLQVIDEAVEQLNKLPSGRCLADVVYENLPEDLERARKQLRRISSVLSRVGV